MFLIANTFAICFNKDYLLTYLLTVRLDVAGHIGTFSDIRLQKMLWPWNPAQGSLKVIESGTPYDRLGMVSYYCPVRYSFTFEKYCDLETGVRSLRRSLKMTLFDTPPMISYYMFHSKMALCYAFSEIFNVEKSPP